VCTTFISQCTSYLQFSSTLENGDVSHVEDHGSLILLDYASKTFNKACSVNTLIKVGTDMASAEQEAIMESGGITPVWSRDRDLGQRVEGVRGQSLLMLKAFCISEVQLWCKFVHLCYPVL